MHTKLSKLLPFAPRLTSASRGFTIVELLVVIVIIAILAAITIVAYNGITNKASVASNQSLLAQVYQRLTAYQTENSAYPPDLATVSITPPSTTTLQYSYSNDVTPNTFCVTATTKSISYYVSDTITSPKAGACSGQNANGTITNLVLNPSLEASTGAWASYAAGGTVSIARGNNGGWSGPGFFRMTWTAAATSISGGCYPVSVGTGSMLANDTYTASMYVRPSKNEVFRTYLAWRNSANSLIRQDQNTQTVVAPASTWTRITQTGVAPAGTDNLLFYAYLDSTGLRMNGNDYLDCDAAMVTDGPTLYNYADGSYPNWSWTGATGNSFSVGTPY